MRSAGTSMQGLPDRTNTTSIIKHKKSDSTPLSGTTQHLKKSSLDSKALRFADSMPDVSERDEESSYSKDDEIVN